jgi:transposase
MARKSDPRKIEEAKRLARQGLPTSKIASQLGTHPNTVRMWAGKELETYKSRQKNQVKRLARQGKPVDEIHRITRVPERTIYEWAGRELKTALFQAKRKRWGSDRGQQ